jgi:DNA polymerase
MSMQAAAAKQERWQQLELGCASCELCSLASLRTQVVLGRGNATGPVMLIGEAPGAEEDACGQPFVGRAGQLLEQLLARAELSSNSDLYICNMLKCRPPANRKPTAGEMALCKPWLLEQIALVDPPLIVLAGASALKGVLGIKGSITKLRGHWQQWGERQCLPIFHPSYLLRFGSQAEGSPRELTLKDLQDVRKRLQQRGWSR